MEFTKEQLQEKFKTLPGDIQELVMDDDFGPAVTLLCKEVGVDVVKAFDVEDEVFDVLMGTSHPKDFIQNIQTKIGVDEGKARAIAEKVNEEIFQLVKESLKVVHNITEVASLASVSTDAPRSTFNVPQPGSPRSDLGPTPMPPTPPVAPKPPIPPTPLNSAPNTQGPATSAFPQMIVPPKITIETPPIPSTPDLNPPQNIFEQKLQGVFKMPKEETLIPPKPDTSVQSPQPPHASGVDPYREQAK